MKKKILLIAPLFFNYYKEIMTEAESLGYEIDYICDAPSNSNISKAIGRINKNFLKLSTKKYFNNYVIKEIKGKTYDYILLIAGMTFSLTPKMIEIIKNMNPDSKCIMYQWDSESNLSYCTKIHHYFNHIYTFDMNDYLKNTYYKFLPLFYTKSYQKIGLQNKQIYKYDCCYIGTAHPKKYKEITLMSKSIKEKYQSQYIYHYMPSIMKYIYQKVISPEFKSAHLSDLKKEKLSTSQIMEIISDSRCVLDAPQEGQTGLTIRTIECLGAKKKLITTNQDIKKYDFYNPSNILIYSDKIDFNSSFFSEVYSEIDDKIYQKYSLKNWLLTLLKEGGTE